MPAEAAQIGCHGKVWHLKRLRVRPMERRTAITSVRLLPPPFTPHEMSEANGTSDRVAFDAAFELISAEIINELPQFDAMSQDGIDWLKRVRCSVTAYESQLTAIYPFKNLHYNVPGGPWTADGA